MRYFLRYSWLLVLTWPLRLDNIMIMLLIGIITNNLWHRVNILNVLNDPMLLHIFNKVLLLTLLSHRWSSRWLCYGCVFYLEAPPCGVCIQHLHPDKTTQLLLSNLSSSSSPALVYHPFDKIRSKLWLLSILCLTLICILLRNLNLCLLLYLNLNIRDSRWNLTIDNQVWGRWGTLPNLVLAYDLDSTIILRSGSHGSHQWRGLLVFTIVQHLSLLRWVYRVWEPYSIQRHFSSVKIAWTLLLLGCC